jgi:ubiquinone/menaquinone biosynthesis C-methylase UbiE
MDEQPISVAQVFDTLADSYDQTGVSFFGPVGRQLVELLDAAPGERCLDVGCGRGAVTLPLAAAVAPGGTVHGVDVSAGMLAGAERLVAAAGLDNVELEVADAADLSALPADFDVVASSLVLFFLENPASALRTWVERLRPGGRIGLVTFGEEDEASEELEKLMVQFAPPRMRDPKTVGAESPFATESGMEEMLAGAGAREVRTELVPTTIRFDGVDDWQRWSMSTGQRVMWQRMPAEEKPRVVARAEEILEPTRPAAGGPCELVWQMRYTLGVR